MANTLEYVVVIGNAAKRNFKQQTNEQPREQNGGGVLKVEDDAEGHLVYQRGDVLQARCTKHYSAFILNVTSQMMISVKLDL